MNEFLIGALAGGIVGLLWHQSLLGSINLVMSHTSIRATRIIFTMLMRVSLVGMTLAVLLILGGLYCLLSALATMMAVRSYAGIRALRSIKDE